MHACMHVPATGGLYELLQHHAKTRPGPGKRMPHARIAVGCMAKCKTSHPYGMGIPVACTAMCAREKVLRPASALPAHSAAPLTCFAADLSDVLRRARVRIPVSQRQRLARSGAVCARALHKHACARRNSTLKCLCLFHRIRAGSYRGVCGPMTPSSLQAWLAYTPTLAKRMDPLT